jgi:hypothetical protein
MSPLLKVTGEFLVVLLLVDIAVVVLLGSPSCVVRTVAKWSEILVAFLVSRSRSLSSSIEGASGRARSLDNRQMNNVGQPLYQAPKRSALKSDTQVPNKAVSLGSIFNAHSIGKKV